MIEINWSEIDPKYKFAAMDADGSVYVYENKPEAYYLGRWLAEDGDDLKIAQCIGWAGYLQERPTE